MGRELLDDEGKPLFENGHVCVIFWVFFGEVLIFSRTRIGGWAKGEQQQQEEKRQKQENSG